MAEPIVIDVPAACQWISTNDRQHWRVRAGFTSTWRERTAWRAKQLHIRAMQRAEIEALLIFPVRRRRDPHNFMPTIKAAIDGLVDAGVLPDDDSTHLTVGKVEHGEPDRSLPRGRGILRLLITDVGGAV